jgi:hypothetical protein
MEKSEITIFRGDGLVDFVDRLGFALMEVGVRIKMSEIHDEYITFEFRKAERLENAEEEN